MVTARAVSTSDQPRNEDTNESCPDIGERLAKAEWLDAAVDPLEQIAEAAFPDGTLKDALQGRWLGHPLHPALTDLPIGFWTSAFVLDFTPSKSAHRAADVLVGLGVLTALPTAAAGLADWLDLPRDDKRTGVVHAASNAVALAFYGMSFAARVRHRRISGMMLSLAGAAAATAGGYLGGHLVYKRGAGVDPPRPQ